MFSDFMCRDLVGFLVLGFVIQASLVSAGENDSVRVSGDGVAAHYDVTVRIDLSRVSFHFVVGLNVVIN